MAAFIAGSEHLDGVDDSAPDDLVWAPLEESGLTLVAGRTSEVERLRQAVKQRAE